MVRTVPCFTPTAAGVADASDCKRCWSWDESAAETTARWLKSDQAVLADQQTSASAKFGSSLKNSQSCAACCLRAASLLAESLSSWISRSIDCGLVDGGLGDSIIK